jgi:hypothetical protein
MVAQIRAAEVALAKTSFQNHPPGFEKKVLGWRFGPATRQG